MKQNLKVLCVIPSRMGSTRLARKPLALIQGKPMIQRVYERAITCSLISKVIVATDSEEIAAIIKNCGGHAVMTNPALLTGSDRVAEVAKQYEEMEVIINLQGDEPFIKASMLEALLTPYLNGENPELSTLAYPLDMNTAYQSSDAVKVITDLKGNALYFSRSPIPYLRNQSPIPLPVYHHMGVYAFKREALLKFTKLAQTPLEISESLEQLRALENGWKIRVCPIKEKTLEINTPEELARAQGFKND